MHLSPGLEVRSLRLLTGGRVRSPAQIQQVQSTLTESRRGGHPTEGLNPRQKTLNN